MGLRKLMPGLHFPVHLSHCLSSHHSLSSSFPWPQAQLSFKSKFLAFLKKTFPTYTNLETNMINPHMPNT